MDSAVVITWVGVVILFIGGTLTAPESAAIWTVMQSKAQLYSHLMRECHCSAGVAVVTTSANLDTLKTSNPIPSTKDIVSGVTS